MEKKTVFPRLSEQRLNIHLDRTTDDTSVLDLARAQSVSSFNILLGLIDKMFTVEGCIPLVVLLDVGIHKTCGDDVRNLYRDWQRIELPEDYVRQRSASPANVNVLDGSLNFRGEYFRRQWKLHSAQAGEEDNRDKQ